MNRMGQLAKPLDSKVFMHIFKKRSRQTPAEEHPQAEQRVVESRVKSRMKEGKGAQENVTRESERLAKIEKLSAFNRKLYDLISIEKIDLDSLIQKLKVEHRDLILPLTELEDLELIEKLPANYYRVKKSSDQATSSKDVEGEQHSNNMKKRIQDCKDYIRETFDGISRKYLQSFVAIFWCVGDKRNWGKNKLLNAYMQSPEITYSQILNYETPPEVNFVFFASKSRKPRLSQP